MVSLLIVLTVGASATPASTGFVWNIPETVRAIEVPGVTNVGTTAVRFRAVISKVPVGDLVMIVLDSFDAAGLYYEAPSKQVKRAGILMVTGYDPKAKLSYTAIFQSNKDGTTNVILGEAKLGLKPKQPTPGLPTFPGATNVMQSDFEGAKTVAYQAKAMEAEVAAFYTDVLKRQGFEQSEPNFFTKDGESIRLSLRPVGDLVEVLVIQLRQGSPGPPKP